MHFNAFTLFVYLCAERVCCMSYGLRFQARSVCANECRCAAAQVLMLLFTWFAVLTRCWSCGAPVSQAAVELGAMSWVGGGDGVYETASARDPYQWASRRIIKREEKVSVSRLPD